jgi:acyl-[acyl carrier protein]--UDP-N-acetylglucosamine O-acyltransferase
MRELESPVSVVDICTHLGCEIEQLVQNKIRFIGPLSSLRNEMLSFSNKTISKDPKFQGLIIAPHDSVMSPSIIHTKNPRLSFIFALDWIIKTVGLVPLRETMIPRDLIVGNNVTIGKSVKIGANSIIENNVTINDNVEIGSNCYIKSNSVIGAVGFGFERDSMSVPHRFPHVGDVVIGNNVEIGSFVSINRASLGSTQIGNNVKIDDHVHIAHNVSVADNTLITACVEISGSVTIGKNCWIGPNSSIIQKINIGDNSTIGIGSIITENIGKNKIIMGLNGIELRGLVLLKKRIQYGK